MEPMTFRSPASLAAALPAIFGFRPERSLIAVTVANNQLGMTMRVDLDENLAESVDQIAVLAARQGSDFALLFVIDDSGTDHRVLIAATEMAFTNVSIPVLGAVAIDTLTAGATWRCVQCDCGADGVLDDPAASPASMATVLAGRPIFASRGELDALIAPDADRASALEPLLAACTSKPGDDDGWTRRSAEALLAAVGEIEAGNDLDDARLAAVAAPLIDLRVRDMMFATSLSEQALAVEQLWVVMARALPQPYRAEALALLAASSYSRGDGTLAGIALEAILQHNPNHRLARLLDRALQNGAPPSLLHQVAELGYQLAADAGVALPTRRVQTT